MRSYLFVSILLLVFLFNIHTLIGIDFDLGLHLTIGQLIWQTHSIPTTNLFSYTFPDFSWGNDFWLSKIIFYLWSLLFGLKGLIILTAIICTVSFALAILAFPNNYPLENTTLVASWSGLIAILIMLDRTMVRPEIFSFLCWSWYLFVLFGNRKRLLWTLPIIQLVWINTHIYFFLGPVIYFIYCLSKYYSTKNYDVKRVLKIGAIIVLVNIVNPYGWREILYPISVWQNYAWPVLENLTPWQLLSNPVSHFTIFAFIIGALVSVTLFGINFYKNRKLNILDIGVLILSLGLSLKMVRNFPIFALASIPINIRSFINSGFMVKHKLVYSFSVIIFAIASLILVTNNFYPRLDMIGKFGLEIPHYPQEAIDFVKNSKLKGPIFNNYDIGSFLVWKLPEEKVFIDGRPEAYPQDFIENVFTPMLVDPRKWKLYSDQYGVNFVFFRQTEYSWQSQKFLKAMINNPDWPIVYVDPDIIIFVRNNEKNNTLIKQTEIIRQSFLIEEINI